MPSSEILAVLADEVSEAGGAIGAQLAALAAAPDAAAFDEARARYRDQVQRIGGVCDALSMEGLQRVCAFIEHNLELLGPGMFDSGRERLFECWIPAVLGYLKAPRDGVYGRELAELFRRAAWPAPLDAAAGAELERSLCALDAAELDAATAGPQRETLAQPQDVALEIPSDCNPKLVDAFLSEGPAQAAEYSALIQQIVRGEGWAEELNECRRLVHALKGSANTVGVRGVATLCHHVEDLLEYLAERAQLPRGELAQLLIRVADTLEMMFETLLGTGEAPLDALAVLQRVLDCINRMEAGEELSAPAPAAPADEAATRPERPEPKVEAKVRVAGRLLDDMLRASGEMTISGGHIHTRVHQALKVVAELRERQSNLWDRATDMEEFVGTQGIAATRRQVLAAAGTAPAGFDPLEMDQYSELHTFVHALAETVADLQILGSRLIESLTAVDTAVGQQAAINTSLHEMLLSSRMLPAAALESRLARTVRQAAEQSGKHVRFAIEGAEVMLDDHMINVLIDPLQHLLRNAVDHGTETPATRLACGKDETGRIVLGFRRDGNYLVIACRDDGAGLDLARIYAHAVECGLVDGEARLSDEEIARLVLRPGFSTAAAVTELSGRGVGMDIVNTHVGRLKGTLDIRTQAGRGTTFTLRLPMSLGIAHCLIASVGGQAFALPSDNLERIVYEGAHAVTLVDGAWRYREGELDCPAYTLAHLVGATAFAGIEPGDGQRHLVLMKDPAGTVAIVVEAVTAGQDLVIKKLGHYLRGVVGTVGASILGDGSVVPILELADLLRVERGDGQAQRASTRSPAPASAHTEVLVVDDSLSVRTALATLLGEHGFQVRTAKDGLEAIESLGEHRPALVLADLEMPRMNGLELTAHIRANAALRALPVVMITSRTAAKHRNLAQAAGVSDYITKPYQEDDLVTRLRTLLARAA
jgi:chemosensory pili system protein ChpA (sensor histidine kinase/response regulator)